MSKKKFIIQEVISGIVLLGAILGFTYWFMSIAMAA